MASVVRQKSATRTTGKPARLALSPWSAGLQLSPREFDQALFDEETAVRYELIQGILVVSPMPLPQERDPNGFLDYLLRKYQLESPDGKNLDRTLAEQDVACHENRRRADRVIWAGLGRRPNLADDVPTIVIEFVSEGKRNWLRDYETKRNEYLAIGVKEYWIIDRFDKTMTVYTPGSRSPKRKDVKANQKYTTPLLPGFELPLQRLFTLADEWET